MKYTSKRTIEKLDNGYYKILLKQEDYYSEEKLLDLLKLSKAKLEKCTQENSLLTTESGRLFGLYTMMTPYIGQENVFKFKKLNGHFTKEDQTFIDENYSDEQKENMKIELEDKQIEHMIKVKSFIEQQIDKTVTQNKIDIIEVTTAIKWWKEALDNGYSEMKDEREI